MMTTTLAEPEWDEETRNLVLALDAVDICPLCRNPTAICQDPDRQFDWRAGAPVRCHVTTARLLAQRGVTEQSNPAVQALLWPVILAKGEPG